MDALRSAGYSGLLASVLAARGVTTPEAAAEKLERERKLTLSPLLMKDMDRAVARIQQAIADGETMAVFGDYDVDGITATVVVEDYLRRQGAECLRYIPRRVEDGYGLSLDAIRRLREKGATLLITVDCGVTGVEEVDYARSLGSPAGGGSPRPRPSAGSPGTRGGPSPPRPCPGTGRSPPPPPW